MTRVLLTTVLLLGLVVLTLALRDGSFASADAKSNVVLRLGDTVTVEGGKVGCQVTELSGRPTLDCRRAGALKGTYGAMIDKRRARIVRFRSSDTAKVVFKAEHRGRSRRCGKGS